MISLASDAFKLRQRLSMKNQKPLLGRIVSARSLLSLALTFLTSSVNSQGVNVFEVSISELQAGLEQGAFSSVQLVDQYLARIEAYDKRGPSLNSIIRVNNRARQIAAELDQERLVTGPRSLLHGIPILIKDNYNTLDMPTSNGSVAFANAIPSSNATQIELLLAAGAIILAKTNLHEFARGITSISSLVGQTRNPYDLRRVPGGSSGGTGAAVAASFGAIGMGSDTCGSIRIPAAFNNLFGLRPTKGLSSIHGIMPLSHTQDTAGPLARSLPDLAIILDLIAGYDEHDPATAVMRSRTKPSFVDTLESVDLEGVRIGRIKKYFDVSHTSVLKVTERALAWYESVGAEVIDVEIPFLEELILGSGVIGFEFKNDLNAYLSENQHTNFNSLNEIVEYGLFHDSLKNQMARSADTESDEEAYLDAIEARETLLKAIMVAFEKDNLDVIAYPTITELPVMIGESQSGSACHVAAQSGLPALSMPVGFSDGGTPIGLELLGKSFDDAKLLAIARPFEIAKIPRKPPSVTPQLIDMKAPAVQKFDVVVDEQGITFLAEFEFSIEKNNFSFTVTLEPETKIDIFAITISTVSEGETTEHDAIALTLLGPNENSRSGDFFMTEKFRKAYLGGTMQFRIFAESLQRDGLTIPIRLLDK